MNAKNVPALLPSLRSQVGLDSDVSKTIRVLGDLTHIFELELALTQANVDRVETNGITTSSLESHRSTLEQGISEIRDALSVIVTSAFLAGRYSQALPAPCADITHHLDRIRTSVDRAETEIRRLDAITRQGRTLAHSPPDRG